MAFIKGDAGGANLCPAQTIGDVMPRRRVIPGVLQSIVKAERIETKFGSIMELSMECGHKRKEFTSLASRLKLRTRCMECPPPSPPQPRPRIGRGKTNVGTCIVPGCGRPQYRIHMCNNHSTAVYQGFLNSDGTRLKCICSECKKEFIKGKNRWRSRTDGGIACDACKKKRSHRLKMLWFTLHRCRNTPAYLRFLPQLESAPNIYGDQRCAVKGCPFPHMDGSVRCIHHERELAQLFSGTDSNIGPIELYGDETHAPVLSVIHQQDINTFDYIVERNGKMRRENRSNASADSHSLTAMIDLALSRSQQCKLEPVSHISVTLAPRVKEKLAWVQPENYSVGKGVGGRGFGKRVNIKRSQYAKKKVRVQNKTGTKHGAHDDRKRWNRDSLLITGKWDRHTIDTVATF